MAGVPPRGAARARSSPSCEASGIELERDAVETLFPVATVSATPKPPERQARTEAIRDLDAAARCTSIPWSRSGKISNPAEDGIRRSQEWLEKNKRVPER